MLKFSSSEMKDDLRRAQWRATGELVCSDS